MSLISLVVPVFREERNLARFYAKVQEVVQGLPDYQWEFLFVNDGSPDNSLLELIKLSEQDPRVKVIDFSRNFGKEIALSAGVHHAKGDAVITLDADLQHPPDLIPSLVAQWEQGAEIVATIRIQSIKQAFLRKLGSTLFYWLMARISKVEMVNKTTDYRLIDKKIVKRFNCMTERSRMYRGMIDWMGYKKVYVEFVADPRDEGVAGYSYRKLIDLAINSITSFSVFPLKLAAYLGLVITGVSTPLLALALFDFIFKITALNVTPSAIIVLANMLLNGVVLMCLGFIALYIGNIHDEVTNRHLYLVKNTYNLEPGEMESLGR